MQRRELLKGVALGGLAATLLAPTIAAVAQDKTASEAAQALAELQSTLDELEAAFATPAWNLRTPQDYAEARRVTFHTLLHGL